MSTSEAAARKERDLTMEEKEEEGTGEHGEGSGGIPMSSQERVPTMEEREEGTGEHGEGSGGIPMSSNMKGGKERAKEISTSTAVGSQERVPTVEEREEGTGEHGHGEGSGGIPMSSQERVPTVEEREEGTGEHGEGSGGIPMSRSSVVSFAAAAAASRPWKDKRKRSSRARLCDQLPKPSRVGFNSILSQAAEIIQERLGTAHNLEGLDGVAKLKKV